MKKNLVITGATNGIGLSVVKQLANKNFKIFLIGKNKVKGDQIIKNFNNPYLNYINCDLSELSEIKALINELNKLDRIDILINNAGAIFSKRVLNSNKIEKTFVLNHLSYFFLTLGLVEKLKLSNDPMVINVTSQAHKRYNLDLNDIENKKFYSGWKSYCRSKLLNVLFTYEFSKRYNIRCNCLHPGFVNTNFGNNNISLFRFAVNILKNIFAISPEKGSETIIHLIFNDLKVSGRYFKKCKEFKSSNLSYDKNLSKQVWDLSYKYIEKYL